MAPPDRLHFTGDDEADRLLVDEPFALLVGFALDQQVSVPRAFSAPLELKRRLGTLDPAAIAATDPEKLDHVFRAKPALHRFPGAMAERTHALASVVAEEYGGEASRLWKGAADGDDLRRRLEALPGFGPMKVVGLGSVLAKLLGVEAAEPIVPHHPTLGDVDSPEAYERYAAAKRAYKASRRAQPAG